MKKISTAFRNFLAQGGGWVDALGNGRIRIYTGAQPATPDAAPTGTLLATIVANRGIYTPEVRATATVELAGVSGSVDALTVAGIPLIHATVPFNNDIIITAADLATAINTARPAHRFTATVTAATVTIKAPKNSGAYLNGLPVAFSGTTLTGTINGGASSTLGGTGATTGVTTANGLVFGGPSAGVINKTADVWSGIAVASGTAGWMRFEGEGNDDQSSGTEYIRLDCSIGTSGADINISNAQVAAGAEQTFSPFTITISEVQTGA